MWSCILKRLPQYGADGSAIFLGPSVSQLDTTGVMRTEAVWRVEGDIKRVFADFPGVALELYSPLSLNKTTSRNSR
jgi:hypothetical protein